MYTVAGTSYFFNLIVIVLPCFPVRNAALSENTTPRRCIKKVGEAFLRRSTKYKAVNKNPVTNLCFGGRGIKKQGVSGSKNGRLLSFVSACRFKKNGKGKDGKKRSSEQIS